MTPIELNMCFRGDRNYLHGTSMYTESIDALQRELGGDLDGPFKMAIHKIARRSLAIMYGLEPDLPKKPTNVIAELSFWHKKQDFKARLVETDQEVTTRSPYQESIITDRCITHGETIQLNGPSGFLPIEELICMTKVLHNEKYPPKDFRWFFSRLELNRLLDPSSTGKLQVAIEGILGNKITRSTISENGVLLGRIFFSKVTQ